jgi:hypothetical protein
MNDNTIDIPTKYNQRMKVQEEINMLEKKIDDYTEQVALVDLIAKAPSGPDISVACDQIKRLLLEKNIAYGNSALSPISIFAKAGAAEGIANRIDDKLNRIKNNQSYPGDNDVDDLIGYLILYKISNSVDK